MGNVSLINSYGLKDSIQTFETRKNQPYHLKKTEKSLNSSNANNTSPISFTGMNVKGYVTKILQAGAEAFEKIGSKNKSSQKDFPLLSKPFVTGNYQPIIHNNPSGFNAEVVEGLDDKVINSAEGVIDKAEEAGSLAKSVGELIWGAVKEVLDLD